MAFKLDAAQNSLPKVAASAVGAHFAVTFSASAVDEVVPVGTQNVEPGGMSVATAASAGNPVAVQVGGVAKAVAAASVGVGANVGVGSPNGALAPVASAATAFRVGISQTAAAEAEIFSVLIRPDRVDF